MMYKLFMVISLHYITSFHSSTLNINKIENASEKKLKFGKEAFFCIFQCIILVFTFKTG
jgi:hypothetical protein